MLLSLNHENVTRYEDSWDDISNMQLEYKFYENLSKEFPQWKDVLSESFEERYDEEEDSERSEKSEDRYDSERSDKFEAHYGEEDSERSSDSFQDQSQNSAGVVDVKYICMELCEDGTLDKWIDERGKRKTDHRVVVLKIMQQITSAVEHLHQKGFMHRDVKVGCVNLFLNLLTNAVCRFLSFNILFLADLKSFDVRILSMIMLCKINLLTIHNQKNIFNS